MLSCSRLFREWRGQFHSPAASPVERVVLYPWDERGFLDLCLSEMFISSAWNQVSAVHSLPHYAVD
jgi:hypothetical protein